MRGRPTKFSKSGSMKNRRGSNSWNLSRFCVWRCVNLVAWLFLGGGFFSLKAATLPAGFTESHWGSAMPGAATAMAFAPDGRLFVCLQSGQVRVIEKDGIAQSLHPIRELKPLCKVAGHTPSSLVEPLRIRRPRRSGATQQSRAGAPVQR